MNQFVAINTSAWNAVHGDNYLANNFWLFSVKPKVDYSIDVGGVDYFLFPGKYSQAAAYAAEWAASKHVEVLYLQNTSVVEQRAYNQLKKVLGEKTEFSHIFSSVVGSEMTAGDILEAYNKSMKKLHEDTEPLEAEIKLDTIEAENAESLSSEVLNEIAELADESYDLIFKVGSANIPAEAAAKINTSHENLLAAFEILQESADAETGEVVNEQKEDKPDDTVADERKTQLRIRDLAYVGMIDRAAVFPVVRLVKDMQSGVSLSAKQRKLAITLLNGLIDVVTGDLVFQTARREIKKNRSADNDE